MNISGLNLDALLEPEITRGKISYQISEVSDVEAALDVFETIRLSLGGVKEATPVAVIAALSREDFKSVRETLYRFIKYRDGKSPKWKPILNNGNAPFVGQSPMIHYELVVRAWCISFLDGLKQWLDDINALPRVQAAFESLSQFTPT